MSSVIDTYDIELFRIDRQALHQVNENLLVRKYTPYIPRSVMNLFKDDTSCLWHLTEILRAKEVVSTVGEIGARKYLVVLGDHDLRSLTPYFMTDPDYRISLNYERNLKLNLANKSDFTI